MIEQTEKRILLTDNSIQVAGETQIIHGHVNIERYGILRDLELRSAIGVDFAGMHRTGKQWTALKNSGKGFEADVMMQNMLDGTALRKVNRQHDPLLLICTLFICPATEDRRYWNEETANEKIKLWSEEGYPTEDFLRLGLQFSRRYQFVSEEDSLNGSENPE